MEKKINSNIEIKVIQEHIWHVNGYDFDFINQEHRLLISRYLERLNYGYAISITQSLDNNIRRYLNNTTPRYIYDIFSWRNTIFNDKYIWQNKLYSHKEFISIENRFRNIVFEELEHEIQMIINEEINYL